MLPISLLYTAFTMFKYEPLIPDFSKTFKMKGCWILSNDFQDLMKWPFVFFFFEFDYVVVYIDGFLYIEPSQHPWDESYLIMMNDSFDVFLDSVGKSFI